MGRVVWITGLPASGKSTLAELLILALRERGISTLWLDSDDLRRVLTPSPSYSDIERDWFYAVIAHLAHRASEGGVTVVISATAPKRVHRDRARRTIARFTEVYLVCDRETLLARDPKHLYQRSTRGEITNLPGAGTSYEPPLSPELTFDSGRTAAAAMVKELLSHLLYPPFALDLEPEAST